MKKRINEHFNIRWSFNDFVEAYILANAIDVDDMSDERSEEIEKKVKRKLTVGFLEGLRNEILSDVEDRIVMAMDES